MKLFLIKTDPETYSTDNFATEGNTTWNGVRNPQAVNILKSMQPGDLCLLYHSGGEGTITALVKVLGNSRPDPKDTRSWLVDMQFLHKFPEPYVTLKDIKQSEKFPHFKLVTHSRLSVMDVPLDVIEYLNEKGLHLPKELS
jgi:predicted RNA-binding protein with PUA-like domain